MRKKMIISSLILVLMLLGATFIRVGLVSGYDYATDIVGRTFTYKVNTANMKYEYNIFGETDSGTFDSLEIAPGMKVNEGGTFTIKVDNTGNDPIKGDYVNATITAGGNSITETFYADYGWNSMIETVISGSSSEEFEFNAMIFFSGVITYTGEDWWTALESNLIQLAEAAASGEGFEGADFKINNKDEEFGFVIQLDEDQSQGETTAITKVDFRIVWDKATGALNGILAEVDINIDGSFQGIIFKMVMKGGFEVVQEGYEIEGFGGEGGIIPGFEMTCLFSIFIVFAIAYRRRK